jgi:acyl-CoA reductase-like NAD-dependent aldehyde dehydrogenase
LAVGAPIILKPPPQAPSAALILAGIALEAGALPGAFSVVPCAAPLAEKMATDPRVRVLSFTGSARVGWHLRSLARGRVVLELGGNAAAVVCADADLDRAAEKIAPAAYAYAGQVCISVQRILVHTSVREAFLERLLARIRQLVVGDPDRRETVVGPLIDDASVERVERWVEAGLRAGGTCALRGARAGRVIDPILLCDVPAGQEVIDQEIFGPVAVVESFGELGEGLRRVNASRYGLQAGLFTRDLNIVRRAHEALEVGGLIVNDSPMFRSDAMPYGGVKDSGLGREGVRYAMEDFTEPRALVVAPP